MSRFLSEASKGATRRYRPPPVDRSKGYAIGPSAAANLETGQSGEFQEQLKPPKPKVRNIMDEEVKAEVKKGSGLISLCGCPRGKCGGSAPHSGFETGKRQRLDYQCFARPANLDRVLVPHHMFVRIRNASGVNSART